MVIDIIILGIFLVFALVGIKKGFVYMVINFFKGMTSVIVAILLAKPVASLLSFLKVNELIGKLFQGINLTNSAITEETFNTLLGANASISGEVLGQNISGSVGFILKSFFNNLFSSEAVYASYSDVVNRFCYAFGTIVVVILSAILVFILIKFALNIINKIFTNEAGARRFGALDRFLGMILGLLKAVLSILVFMAIVNVLGFIPVIGTAINNLIETTTITKGLYTFISNIIHNVIAGLDFNTLIATLFNK